MRHMRSEFYFPKLANRDKRESLENPDALSAARRFVAELRAEEASTCLEEATRARVVDAFPELRLLVPAVR